MASSSMHASSELFAERERPEVLACLPEHEAFQEPLCKLSMAQVIDTCLVFEAFPRDPAVAKDELFIFLLQIYYCTPQNVCQHLPGSNPAGCTREDEALLIDISSPHEAVLSCLTCHLGF